MFIKHKINKSTQIFIGMFLGLTLGLVFQYLITNSVVESGFLVFMQGIGKMFVSLIKLMVLPLVFFSVICGITSLSNMGTFSRLGSKIAICYIVNTILAIVVSIAVVKVLGIGIGLNFDIAQTQFYDPNVQAPDLWQMIVQIIPSNPIKPFVNGDMLQVLFMAIVIGIAIQGLGDSRKAVIYWFERGNEIVMELIRLVMNLAPLGVFALMIGLGANFSIQQLFEVAGYVVTALSLLLVWTFVVYPLSAWLLARVSPVVFVKNIKEQILFSLGTASSNATIPVTMKTVTEKFGVRNSIASFGVPLGATINMAGVAVYIMVATLFFANVYDIVLTAGDYWVIAVTVFLLSVGAGGVPGGGIVMCGVMFEQVGIPLEALAIVAAVDRIIDMFCTSANVVGDTAVNVIVGKSEEGR